MSMEPTAYGQNMGVYMNEEIREIDIDRMNDAEQEFQQIEARKTPYEKLHDLLCLQRHIMAGMICSIDRFLEAEEALQKSKDVK